MSTPLPVRFTPRAIRQLDAASDWWKKNRPDAPTLLRIEVQRALAQLSTHPRSGTLFPHPRIKRVRRANLLRVRYSIYYRIRSSSIQVLAFWHSNRGAGPF